MATSGTQRPGGRTERTRQAVLHATLDLLAERGFGELTVDAVAERSGVHKTTVYRRWSSPDGLVAAALQMGAEDDWTAPDTGSLEDDLYEVAAEVVRYFTEPALKELPTASVLAAFQSPQAAEALHDFYADRHVRMAPIAERAVARDEIPAGDGRGRARAGGVRADLLSAVPVAGKRHGDGGAGDRAGGGRRGAGGCFRAAARLVLSMRDRA